METVIATAKDKMSKSLTALTEEFNTIRTGRASSALFEKITVDYYGQKTPLNQVATIYIPEARLVVIQPWDKGLLNEIEKAIQKSELSMNPNNDGKVIRLQIPPLTEERRKQLVKQVRKVAEDHRIRVRDARRDSLSMLKDLEDDGLSKDDRHRAEKKVQDVTDEFVKKIDELTAQKEKDVLEV